MSKDDKSQIKGMECQNKEGCSAETGLKLNENSKPASETNTKVYFSNHITGIREWLNRNKIFFDTIVAGIISGITIYIAITANNIQKEQKDIERQAALPIIEVSSEYDKQGNVTAVKVINSGGLLDEISIQIYPYALYEAVAATINENGEINDDEYFMLASQYYAYPLDIIDYSIIPEMYYDIWEVEDMAHLGQYKLLSPNTKTGVIYEIRNTDLMNHLAELIIKRGSYYYEEDVEKERIVFPDDFEDHWIEALSFEYIIELKYNSYIDQEMKTEVFRVSTGIGQGTRYAAGVSQIKEETRGSQIYQTVSSKRRPDYFVFESLAETEEEDGAVEKDFEALYKQLMEIYAAREFCLLSN